MIEDKILLVARYAEGDMDEAEIADFESQLANDPALQQQLKTYQDIHQSLKMKLADDEEFKATLKGFNKQYFATEAKVVSFKPALKWLSGIAAILVIGLFIWAPWNSNLYESYVDESKMLVTERGEAGATDLDKAAELYNKQDYHAAATVLEKLYARQPSNTMIGYYYGLSLLKTNEAEKSRSVLTPIYNGESIFKYDSAYAIALGYLKEEDKVNCKIWLQKIPQDVPRYEQVKQLLEKL